MRLLRNTLLGTAALATTHMASATVLLSNLGEPVRGTTIVDGSFWAAQGFSSDGSASTLQSIRTVLGGAMDNPSAFAELRVGSTSGTVVTTFAIPSLAGAGSVRTLTPLGATALAPNATYYLVLGVNGGGSFGWNYAEGNASTGPGSFANYEYSTDQGASWTNFGGDNPYLMEVNVLAEGVPEPTSWALLILGFGAIGATLRRRRINARLALV